MGERFDVSVDEEKTQVFVGSGEKTKDNKVTIKIVSKTDTTKIKTLTVKVNVGGGETALVSVATGLTLDAVVSPPLKDQLEISGSQPDDSSYSWSIEYGRLGFEVGATDGLVLTLTGIVSETDAGDAKVELAFDPKDIAEVAIRKKQEDVFEIVKFQASSTYLATGTSTVKLTWAVNKASRVQLWLGNNDITNSIPNGKGIMKLTDVQVPAPQDENKFTLIAIKDGVDNLTREIIVRKEKPGWLSLDYSGSYGEPSTLFGELKFGTDSTPSMAVIFIKNGRARLYRSQIGTGVWLQESSEIPAGMETSPGVVFDKKLWLLGGSAVNPDQPSDRIWCYTRDEGWKEWIPKETRFSPRMGHACVVFDEKLWVMGGFDENGNAQNDVWHLAKGEEEWEGPTTADWPERCMFGAASSDDRIVVYGGVKEPFGAGYKDLYSRTKDGSWTKETPPDVKDADYALASVVGRSTKQWYLGATYLISNIETPHFYIWAQKQNAFTKVKEPELETYQVTPYSLSAIGFKGRMFLRALSDRPRNTPCSLHVYVPE